MSTQIKKTNNYVVLGKYELDMVLDIHAHTALTGLFVYGNSYDDVYRSRKQRILWKYLILHFISLALNVKLVCTCFAPYYC